MLHPVRYVRYRLRGSRLARAALAGSVLAIAAAASAAAFQALPPGGQVNDDAAAGNQ
jgi:hypothetical protein